MQREAGSERVLAKIEAEQKILDADLLEAERLQALLEQLDEDRKDARLAHERAKIEREDAAGAIERLKYTVLLRHFPSMDDTTRLVMSRIMTDGRCLACNASANEKRIELERQVARGCCPICGAEPQAQDNVVAPHEFDQAKLERERERAERARREQETKLQQLHDSTARYDEALKKLERIRRSIQDRRARDRRLRAQLPDTTTSKGVRERTRDVAQRAWKMAGIAGHPPAGAPISPGRQKGCNHGEVECAGRNLCRVDPDTLVEKVRLVQVSVEPRYTQAPGQAEDRVQVPAYAAEMTAADRPGFIRRKDPSEVSESQRELIDLAFRLALVEVFGGSCTFVMETPEASLDGLAMERVGRALAAFAVKDDNRLVVTSNLTNAGVITALFDGSDPEAPAASRSERVLNLLQVAAPNRALLEDGERYHALLMGAVSGADP